MTGRPRPTHLVLKALCMFLALCLLAGAFPAAAPPPAAHSRGKRLSKYRAAALPRPAGPGWHRVTITDPATPSEARPARGMDPHAPLTTAGLPGAAAEVTPEIEALARALEDDPGLIFDYVHNHVDHVPLYGSLNGATGALLAGRGTDADQASLFVALMRAAGYSADYVVGDVTYSVDRLANWLGVEAGQVPTALGNGGVPFTNGAAPNTLILTRVWAEAIIGATSYPFDPAMKTYREIDGVDLATATGYDRTALLSTARAGATTTPSYTLHLNEANVRAALVTYTMNLVAHVDAHLPTGSVADVTGGREIVPAELTAYPTTLPHALASTVAARPAALDGLHHTLRVEHAGIDVTLSSFQVAGRRVTLWYDGPAGTPVLRVDGSAVATGTLAAGGPMTLTVDHPYAAGADYFDQSAIFHLTGDGAYAINHDFNTVSSALIARRNARLIEARRAGLAGTAEPVLGESLALTGLAWHRQVHRFARLVDRLGHVRTLHHHRVGVLGHVDGTFIDMPMSMVSVVSHDGASDTWAPFRAQTMMGSALEHGVLEQTQGVPAVSTVKLLQLNNASPVTRTFLANSATWSAVEPRLRNYTPSTKAWIAAGVDADREYVLPEDAHITLNRWRGVGFIDDYQSDVSDTGSMGMIIQGGYYGGYTSLTATLAVGDVISATWTLPPDMRMDIETPEDSDPVDMATGAFHHTHADMAVGPAEPWGLRFVRTYNSGDTRIRGPLGHGWRHNYAMHLRTHSDAAAGLGARGPRDAAALITYAHVVLDLLAGERTIEEWMTATLATQWAMDQLTENAVTVHAGGETLTYVRLPDGTFAPPPGVHRALVRHGSHYSLQGRLTDVLLFEADGPVQAWQDTNGNALTFDYTGDRLRSVASAAGVTLTLHYDADGRLAHVADSVGRAITYTYNLSDELTSFQDAETHTWTYTYDAAHRLATVTRPRGNTVVHNVYDAWGRVITQTDALSHTTSLAFGGFRNAVMDPRGDRTIYLLDDAGRMTAREDPAGNRFTLDYNGRGQRIALTDRLGDVTTFTYHPQSGYLASLTDAEGHTTTYSYTAQLQRFEPVTLTFYHLSGVSYPDGTGEHMAYDAQGNMDTRIDPAGETWGRTFTSRGQVATVINPAGGVTTYTYNTDATLATSADSDLGVTTYEYDAYRRLNKVIHPDGTYLTLAADRNDRVITVTDELTRTYTREYDANGNLVRLTDPTGEAWGYAYDGMDRLIHVTDRMGQTTSMTHDHRGHIASLRDPNGIETRFGYDARGWMDAVTLGGGTWRTTYDAEGVAVARSTPLSHTTHYRTDALGHVTAITDPLGNRTTIHRNAMDQITAIRDPEHRTRGYTYDAGGLMTVVSRTAIGGVTYGRDALGSVDELVDLAGRAWVFDYTKMGRLQTLTDPLSNTWRHTYDEQGRPQHTAYPDGITLTRHYDGAGNLVARAYTDGLLLGYTYDALNRLVTADGIRLTLDAEGRVTDTETLGAHFGATYDDGGRLRTATYDDGALVVTYTYHVTTGLLSGVADSLTGAHMSFTHDDDLRLTTVARSNGITTTYAYDDAGRVTRIQAGDVLDLRYRLDGAGQVRQAELDAPLTATPYLEPPGDAFAYDAASQVSSPGYVYDPRGRLTASPGQTYTWDGASRLTAVNTTTLAYTGLGDLLTRTVGSETVHHHTNHALALRPIVAERDAGSGQILRYYVWTPGGQLLYMIDAGGVHFYHFDHTGSTLALTDDTGAVTDAYAYTPYGRLLGHDGDSRQPFTFVGRWGVRQEGAGGTLYHMRERYYDAETARFISRDPAWPDRHEPKAVNPYEYALRNPALYVDPLGTKGLLSALLQELLGIDLPPTGPWDLVLHATETDYGGVNPEWPGKPPWMSQQDYERYKREGRTITYNEYQAVLQEREAEFAARIARLEEQIRLQRWQEERHKRYLRRLEHQVVHQARVAAMAFGGNREALRKSIQHGGVWIRQGNFWLFFDDVKKWGENFDGGVWVHVEVNGELVGVPGDELIAAGHVSEQQWERGW
jgi:RHS repeat-associated protein